MRSKIGTLFTLLVVIFIASGCEEKIDKKTQVVTEVIPVKQEKTTVNEIAEAPLTAQSIATQTEQPVTSKKEQPVPTKKEQSVPIKKMQPVLAKPQQTAAIKKEVPAPSKTVSPPKEVMPAEHYIDGTYIGEGQGKKGMIKVEVTIKNHRISNIQVKEHGESEGIAEMAFNTVKEFILQQQTTSVEAMSGATKSSQGFKDAVKAALLLSIEVKE